MDAFATLRDQFSRVADIIDALRASEPVDVPAWAEPKWTRAEISEAAS